MSRNKIVCTLENPEEFGLEYMYIAHVVGSNWHYVHYKEPKEIKRFYPCQTYIGAKVSATRTFRKENQEKMKWENA